MDTFDQHGRCFRLYHTDGGYSCERLVPQSFGLDIVLSADCGAWANLQVEITYSDKSSPVSYHICERCAKDAFPSEVAHLDREALQDEDTRPERLAPSSSPT